MVVVIVAVIVRVVMSVVMSVSVIVIVSYCRHIWCFLFLRLLFHSQRRRCVGSLIDVDRILAL